MKVTVSRYALELSKDDIPIRLCVVSDLHIGHRGFATKTPLTYKLKESEILEKIREAKPNGICLVGDLLHRFHVKHSFTRAKNFLENLSEIAPVYFCFGNHELDCNHREIAELKGLERDYPVHVLEGDYLEIGDRTRIYGVTLPRKVYKSSKDTYQGLAPITRDMLPSAIDREKRNILLAHSPFGFSVYREWGADLTIAGHVHGGIVRLPLLGGILSPERKFFPKYTKGLYHEENSYLIVSSGIGKIRIGNPPEVIIIDIT